MPGEELPQSTLGIIKCGVFLGLHAVVPFCMEGGIEREQRSSRVLGQLLEMFPAPASLSNGSAPPPQVMGLVQPSGWDGVG